MLINYFTHWWGGMDPYVSFGSFLIGILALVLSIVFFYKSKRLKKFSYSLRSTIVISEHNIISKLSVFYDNKPVTRLIATKLAVWNSGDITIDKNDLVDTFPLKISLPGGVIYDINIEKASHTANDFTLSSVADGYRVDLGYIEKGEGCIIKVLHSGSETLNIGGRIKGIKTIKNENVLKVETGGRIFWSRWIFKHRLVLSCIGLGVCVLSFAISAPGFSLGYVLACAFLLIAFIQIVATARTTISDELNTAFYDDK